MLENSQLERRVKIVVVENLNMSGALMRVDDSLNIHDGQISELEIEQGLGQTPIIHLLVVFINVFSLLVHDVAVKLNQKLGS